MGQLYFENMMHMACDFSRRNVQFPCPPTFFMTSQFLQKFVWKSLNLTLASFFSKTSRRTLLPLCSSQTPRKKLEKNGALAWPSAKEEVKTGIKKDISQELRWNEEVQFTRNDPDEMCVHGFEWEYPDSMSYFHISDTRGQNERKNAVEQWKSEIINLMTTRLSFCTVWSCFYAVQKDNSLSKSASYIINWSSLCMYKFICILRRVANKKSGSSN